jgi:hypothetical protein
MTLLAEIADKMPTLEVMWPRMLAIAGFCSLFTVIGTLVSKVAGLVPVLLASVISFIFTSPQGSWDEAIVRELGHSYLYQERLSGCLPFVCSLLTWLNLLLVMQRVKPRESQLPVE